MPVLGAVARDDALAMPERHLGLVQAAEHCDLGALFDRLADMAERDLDLDAILAAAAPVAAVVAGPVAALPPPGQRIALAADAAFTFVYPHLLAGWRRAGAEIETFSPLADEPPPPGCDACNWLPGGYPGSMPARSPPRHRFRERADDALPRRGWCTANAAATCSTSAARWWMHGPARGTPLTGLFGHVTSLAARQLHLGYRGARLRHDGALGKQGAVIRGHEFHYASVISSGHEASFADLADAQGEMLGAAGSRRGHVTGTFFHAIAAESGA